MPRPKQSVIRDKRVSIRLTTEELFHITEKAVRSGQTVSDFARAHVLTAEARRKRSKAGSIIEVITATLDPALFQELRKQGVNLNQIAKHCNRYNVPPPASLEPLLLAIRDLLAKSIAPDDR